MKRGRWISVATVVIGSAVIAHALAGDTDLSFDAGSGVDDTPYAITVQGDGKILVGGNFLTVRGLVRNRIARLNADGSGDASFDPGSGANGLVGTIVIQPADGKILVAGSFSSFNGDTSHAYLVRLNTNGSIDENFSAALDGAVSTVAVQADGRIVIGGTFGTVSGTSRARIARLLAGGGNDPDFNPGTGVTNGSPLANGPRVTSLAIQPADGKIVIGGEFSSVNGTTSFYVARLNSNGSVDNGFISPGQYPGFSVYSVSKVLLQPDGNILVAGLWPTSGGEKTIARLSGIDGSLDPTFAHQTTFTFAGANAIALQPADNKIIVGGSFSGVTVAANTYARRQIMRLNTNGTVDLGFELLPGQPAFPTVYVRALALQTNGSVVIGGELSDPVVPGRARVERLTSTGGLDATFVSETGPNGEILSLSLQSNGKVAIGGVFQTIAGQSRNRVAQLLADGTLDPTFNPGTGANGGVAAVAAQADNKVILGGSFTQVGGVGRLRLARLNANGSLDTDFCSNTLGTRCGTPGPGPNDWVSSILVQPDQQILIGGFFGAYNGTARGHIARLNTNGTLDGSFDPGGGASNIVNPTVSSIALDPNTAKVLIAGSFTSFDGQTRNHVARLNTNGSLDSTFVPNTGTAGAVLDFLAVAVQSDSKVIVGGAFFSLQGMTPHRIARLNENGSIDTSFTGAGTNGNVRSLLLQPDGKVVIVGEFTLVNNVARNRLARLNTDGSLDMSFNPNPGANYELLSVLRQPDGKLLVGGNLTSINTAARWRVARVLASACPFTDDPIIVGLTPIRAAHVTELRACIDGVRGAHALTPFAYTHPSIVAGATVITAIDITEMRTALAQAYSAALQAPPTYTHATISAGMIVTAVDIAELRTAALGAP